MAKWHWYDYTAEENSITTLIKNEEGYVSLTVHDLTSGSKVITLFPDVYVNELPPSISDVQGPRSAHVFSHLILEYLEIPHNPEMEVVSFVVGDYRLASYYPHSPEYDTAVWGAEESRPVFDDVAGSFKDNSSFIAMISMHGDTIITEATTPATFTIAIPSDWEISKTWLHVLDENDSQLNCQIHGNKLLYKTKNPGIYRVMYYKSIPWGIWVTQGLYAFIIIQGNCFKIR